MVPFGLGVGLVLFSTIAFAVVTLLFRALSRTDRSTTIVFYQSLFFSVVTFVPAAPVLVVPSAFGFAMVVIMIWKPRGLISTREPTAFLKEKKAISADMVQEGHG